MALNTNFQKVFSSMILRELEKSAVLYNLVNRDYEGLIQRKGDSVNIPSIGAIDVNSYTRNSDITFQEIEDASQTLLIDQEKYAAFALDDVDRLQAGEDLDFMNAAAQEATYAITDDMDSSIAGLYTDAVDTISGTNITSADILGKISELRKAALDYNWSPSATWNLVVGTATESYMLNAKILTDTDNSDALGNGYIGKLYGFNIYSSNNINDDSGIFPNITEYNMAFMTPAITFAQQITRIETGRLESRFAGFVKMLNVYGRKVVRPNQLLGLQLEFATETNI